MRQDARPVLTVFYDGGCPLCRTEIDFYRRRRGADRIDWVDVAEQSDTHEVVPGLSRCSALQRFHVQQSNGQLASGARAFIALWRALPAFRPLGLLVSVPPLPWVAELTYRAFLRLRPRLQAIVPTPRMQD
ncbi:MAG: DUF393 domain-containing protein [Pseudomonadota bacterium]